MVTDPESITPPAETCSAPTIVRVPVTEAKRRILTPKTKRKQSVAQRNLFDTLASTHNHDYSKSVDYQLSNSGATISC
jgi:hypothetical protein